MASEHELTVSLEEFGLSIYEARAYVTLVVRGPATAGDLSYYSGIPRTKVYPTLLKLEKKKLVTISGKKPITCMAVEPQDAFDGIIHEQINKVNAMNTLIFNLKKASEESRRSSSSEEKRYTRLSSSSVLTRLQRMIGDSKATVDIMADQGGMEFLPECKEQMLLALKRNVVIRMVIPPEQMGTKAFRTMPQGVEIRVSDVIQNCIIADGEDVMMVDSSSGDGVSFTSSGILGSNQARVFDGIWGGSVQTDALSYMTKDKAYMAYRVIRSVEQSGLRCVLDKFGRPGAGLLGMLKSEGIDLRSRSLNDLMEMMDAILAVTCSGGLTFEPMRHVTVRSEADGGHALPWISLVTECLKEHNYAARVVFRDGNMGAHIKLGKN